ncbi:hypothetical protein VTH06DRAFT_280 [Thermothelomyces fergusii]
MKFREKNGSTQILLLGLAGKVSLLGKALKNTCWSNHPGQVDRDSLPDPPTKARQLCSVQSTARPTAPTRAVGICGTQNPSIRFR